MACEVRAGDGHVSHEHHGFLCAVSLRHIVEECLHNIFACTRDEGHGYHVPLGNLNDIVLLPSVGAAEAVGGRRKAYQLDISQTPDNIVGMDAGGGVVVPGGDDHCHLWEGVMEGDKVLVEAAFGGGTGLLDIENVATHQQCVGLIATTPLFELAEEMVVLVLAGVVLI